MIQKPTVEQMISSGFKNPYFIKSVINETGISEEAVRSLGKAYADEVTDRFFEYNYEPMELNNKKHVFTDLGITDAQGDNLLQLVDNLIFAPREKIKPYSGFRRLKNRSDGRRIDSINPFMKIMPYVMKQRNDAQVMAKYPIDVGVIDDYIKEKRKDGMSLTYLHVFVAVFVRILAIRPELNRFIMGNRHYARNHISISFSVMKSLRDGGEETTLKFHFTGNESIYDIYHILETAIKKNVGEPGNTGVDKILDICMRWPSPLLSFVAGSVKFADNHNFLHRGLIAESPFHCSIFVTYLKSIKLPSIYHHIYNFGNTSLFLAIGKEEKQAVINDDKIETAKICDLGVVMDERICEGLYLAHTLRILKQHLKDLSVLDKRLTRVLEDID
ncbi:MAG: 2-oxoglutarate dehydrogenase [Tissierellia bacterium]|nr:2-oxoglutarate dehydrogenase [Tissierellia bacterium]